MTRTAPRGSARRGGITRLAAWLGLAVWAGHAAAQEPPAAAPLAPGGAEAAVESRIDVLLDKWSNRTRKIRTLYASFERTVRDDSFGTTVKSPGYAYYMYPNMARIDVLEPAPPAEPGKAAKPAAPSAEESFLLTEAVGPDGRKRAEVWETKPKQFQITISELHDPKQQVNIQEDGPLPFLFGAKPDIAHARYNFKILAEDDRTVQVRVTPKLKEDKENFHWAELTLDQETFLPRKMVLQETRDSRVTYDFPKGFNVDLKLDAEKYFKPWMPKATDKRWKVTRQQVKPPAAGERRVAIRPGAADR